VPFLFRFRLAALKGIYLDENAGSGHDAARKPETRNHNHGIVSGFSFLVSGFKKQGSGMKITNPLLTKVVGFFGASLIRGWTATLDYRIVYQDPTVDPVHPQCRLDTLYLLWHEYLICPLGVRGRKMTVLISQHRDGELITRVLRHLGFDVVRGSSTRGGIAALRQILSKSGREVVGQRGLQISDCRLQIENDNPQSLISNLQSPILGRPPHHLTTSPSALCGRGLRPRLHLIITPDGPRGPRRQLEKGAVFLASRLALPIVCMGFAFDRPWRLASWDRFAIPRPFSRARAVISPFLEIPFSLDPDGFERQRFRVEQVLNQVTLEAEQWAQAGYRKPGELPMPLNEFSSARPYRPLASDHPALTNYQH
jgi:lysophospholipid acyltransferase (LPLAT)-like uncharacterized protein